MRTFYRWPFLAFALAAALAVVFVATGQGRSAEKQPPQESATTQKAGLLIIAHGAPWPAWNKPVIALEPQVREALGKESPFTKVKVVMMEFTKPSVADGITEMIEAGCDRIVAVPLLIAPSSHSHWDIPALLGIYSDQRIKEVLNEQGVELVRSSIPITVTPTLDQSEVLLTSMLERVEELSKDAEEEALVVIAHGDEGLREHWDALMKRITSYICGKTGITYADWAYVHMGQTYGTDAVPVIARAADHRKRVIVVGCYVAFGASRMHAQFMKRPSRIPGIGSLPNPLKGREVAVSSRGLLPDPGVAEWIAQAAKAALSD